MRVVIGPFPDYLELAAALGADSFSMPLAAWHALDPDAQWAANRAFLDRAVVRGAVFVCAIPPDEATTVGFFGRERDYLLSLGFNVRRGATHWELFR